MKIFNNPGKKIISAVNVIFVIALVLTVILGVIFWIAFASEFDGGKHDGKHERATGAGGRNGFLCILWDL